MNFDYRRYSRICVFGNTCFYARSRILRYKFENKFSNFLLEAVSQVEACDMQGYKNAG